MLQDQITVDRNYERFINRVKESGVVWGLKHPENNWAVCDSNDFDDSTVYVFWSDEAYAKRHCVQDWSGYLPTKIPLDSFIDNWLKGMHQDGHLVGPNWDANLFGKEVEPLEIANELVNR